MPRVLRGAKSTPRAIRDLKPKRQLARGQESVDNDWYSDAVASSGDTPFSSRARVASGAVNMNRRTTTGIGRKTCKGESSPNREQLQLDDDTHQDRHRRAMSLVKAILVVATDTYTRIRQTPRRTRIKRCIWTAIVFVAVRTMLNADLETYHTDRYTTNYGNIRRRYVALQEGDTLPSHWENSIAKVADPGMRPTEYSFSKLNRNPIQSDTVRKFGSMSDGRVQRISLFPETDLDDIISNGDTLTVHGISRRDMVPRTQEYSPGAVSNNAGIPQGSNSVEKQASNLQGPPPSSYNTMQQRSSMMQSGNALPPKSYISLQHSESANQPSQGIQQGMPREFGKLDCARHGGPDFPPDHSELIYWQNVPSDWSFRSPFYEAKVQDFASNYFKRKKFLTFEMDDAGFNNMRIGLENVVILALAMGRTLVLPPRRQMAHGLFDKRGNKQVNFDDFYEIEAINTRHAGLNIISMEAFLEMEGITGKLISTTTGESLYPPDNEVKYDNKSLEPLWTYIRSVSKSSEWNPKECVFAFAHGSGANLYSILDGILTQLDGRDFPHFSDFQGRPTKVNAPAVERLREMLAGRRKICLYDEQMHDGNDVIHFKADQFDGTRLIANFNTFLFFADWRVDLLVKRFIRDNLRYRDEVFCLAARIIKAIRLYAKEHSPKNINGMYDAVHIRRGDFSTQFPTAMNISQIEYYLRQEIAAGSTLFVSTDERDHSFFEPLKKSFRLLFLGDFSEVIGDTNPNYFPLAEQLVASRSRIFFGTYFSTFSAMICRIRGYYSVKDHNIQDGKLRNTFYLNERWKNAYTLYQAVHMPYYGRAFPNAWRDIDHLELPT